MSSLVWDKVGDRVYETGLDKGVLYLPDGTAVPWNGLTSIIENFDKDRVPVYYDGMKINDLVSLGSFSATMRAITYPDEFLEIEGLDKVRCGMFMEDQTPKLFGLCYRTKIGNDVDGPDAGHKIHIIYNLTAIPNDKTYNTLKTDIELSEFEWTITAVPEELPGLRPTASIIIDSRDLDPWLMEDLEQILYGDSSANASLIPMIELFTYLNEWARIKIIDNGDKTWTAIEKRPGFITFPYPLVYQFLIENANVTYLDTVTYVIRDTRDLCDYEGAAPSTLIQIIDFGDGSWAATTSEPGLISEVDGEFEIINATITVIDSETYDISDTV